MPMIADQAVRDRALDIARSFIVQAPAGSGKTSLLVARYLKLLSAVRKPEEILAITFTRKAATEMRKRVLENLPNPEDIAHRLRIQTIDALCASLTRQMPVLARFGAQPEIVEDASDLYREAAANTLQLLQQEEFSEKVEKLLAHLDNNVATAISLLADMLARRDQWLRNAGNPPTRAQLEAAFLAERNRLLSRAKELLPEASEELARELLTKEGGWRKRSKQAQDLSENEALRRALAALLKLPPAKYDDAQWEALAAILALLIPAVKQLVALFSAANRIDFVEVAHGALRALGGVDDPSDLLLSLDQKVLHILVDEFQDTSISQWELLERLTAGWQPGDGRSVFLVGDPMQSIYRFREAEVGLFLHAQRAGLGSVRLEAITLTTNFRSQAGFVDWVNAFFPSVLPLQADEVSGAVPYSPSTPHAPALPGAAVEWHCCFERAVESRKTIQIIKAAQGTVAILVRNRSHLGAIVPALKDAGIRYRALEIEQLGEKQVVQDLYALTRALLHPADRVAWLAILRAPWIGLDLSDLSKFFENKSDQTIWELIQAAASLDRFRNVLAPAIANRMRGTLRGRVEGVWLALGGPACVESETDLEDAAIYLDQLERLEEAGGLPELGALEDKLEKLWALPDVGAGPGSVEIMTIHKAKGLEWDTVIVPGLDRAPRSGERELFAWKTLSSSLLLAPINETGSDREPLYEYVRDLNREAGDIEAGRLFYVAATRARHRLHLLACAHADEAGAEQDGDSEDGTGAVAVKPPNKRSLLAKAWFEASGHFASGLKNVESKPADSAPVSPPPAILRRLPADYRLPAPPAALAWEPPPEGRDEAAQIEFSWAGETARHVGSVVHKWLQRIAEDALKGWDAKRVDSLRSHFERDLRRRGADAPGPAAELVATALKNCLADERGRWLLGPHPGARSEYRIRTPSHRLVIDRVLRDEEGRQWIVDFKTSRHTGADVDGFLDRERERYRAQLLRYFDALGGGRTGLYFPLHRAWRDW